MFPWRLVIEHSALIHRYYDVNTNSLIRAGLWRIPGFRHGNPMSGCHSTRTAVGDRLRQLRCRPCEKNGWVLASDSLGQLRPSCTSRQRSVGGVITACEMRQHLQPACCEIMTIWRALVACGPSSVSRWVLITSSAPLVGGRLFCLDYCVESGLEVWHRTKEL